MTEQSTPIVFYGAKSNEDTHGSIPTQLEDCGELAERHGWEVVGTFADEAFSAYSGNRGPGLEDAKALAAQTASERGRCILVAQDADRFARGAGDAPGAADHLTEIYFQMRRQGVELWSVRSGKLDLLRAALEGERATDESQRKSQSVRAGLKRRKDSGKPVGPVPVGYCVEHCPDGTTVRVIDPATAPIVELIAEVAEAGGTTGDAARRLTDLGYTGKRGKPFNPRTIRDILRNDDYGGSGGYPAIIDPERWQRIQDGLRRLDPSAVQRRKGGRRPGDPSYWLRGTLFCLDCGAGVHTVQRVAGRMYYCANRRSSNGKCSAEPIPADLIEGHVLDHLEALSGTPRSGWRTKRNSATTAASNCSRRPAGSAPSATRSTAAANGCWTTTRRYRRTTLAPGCCSTGPHAWTPSTTR